MSNWPRFVSLNGRITTAQQARISVFDRGFLYGDGLFETLRSYHGALVALPDHLARLKATAAMLGIAVPRRAWEAEITELLRRNRLLRQDASVRITLTRGSAALGLLPPVKPSPTVLMIATKVAKNLLAQQRSGVRVTLLPFAKTGFLAEHKLLNYVPAILGKVAAHEAGAFEALYVDRGRISEGTTSNLFICRGGKLITTPLHGLLPGVTRRWVTELAARGGIGLRERPITTRALLDADEAFLTASVIEVLPVTHVDGKPVGSGKVGKLTRRIQLLYRQLVDQRAS